jgi:hypothetical protein
MPVLEGAKRGQSFAIDLGSFTFDDPTESTWIQVLPLGEWKHPLYGDIKITPSRVQQFVKNFTDNVRQIELDVDYDHKDHSGRAAGWIKQLQDRGQQGLWALVDWTTEAYKALKDKQYRYFSPEFADEWTNPATGQQFKDVLFGGAITNRPFLKDILPINLSEVIQANEGEHLMDRAALERLAKRLGIEFTDQTTDVELQAQLAAVETEPPTPPTPPAPPTNQPPAPPTPPAPTPPAPTNAPPTPGVPEPVLASENVKLSDGTIVKASELVERLAKLEAANRLSEVGLQMTTLSEDANFTVSPAARTLLSEIMVEAPKALSDKLYNLVKAIVKDGIVELGERGGAPRGGPRTGESASKQFAELTEAAIKASEGKLSYPDAVEQVGREHPDVWEAYRRESTQREEV